MPVAPANARRLVLDLDRPMARSIRNIDSAEQYVWGTIWSLVFHTLELCLLLSHDTRNIA